MSLTNSNVASGVFFCDVMHFQIPRRIDCGKKLTVSTGILGNNNMHALEKNTSFKALITSRASITNFEEENMRADWCTLGFNFKRIGDVFQNRLQTVIISLRSTDSNPSNIFCALSGLTVNFALLVRSLLQVLHGACCAQSCRSSML